MDKEALQNELQNIIGSYLKDQMLELIELIYRHEGRDLVLKVMADRPEGGISLGDCASLNREIGMILDEKNLIQGTYLLEVSSPGVDRPLKTKVDFLRCINREVRFFLKEPVGDKLEWAGIIKKIEGESVFIDIEDTFLEIPLARINKARQELE
jgi:ribosome maturation factor RimP